MSNAKRIIITIDCPDRFNFVLEDYKQETLVEGQQTYIPDWLTCATSDSHLRLVIDLETGNIINWIRPDARMVDRTIEEYTAEE